MATDRETTAALDGSVAWLANHEHQAETLVREARSLAATVLSGASPGPGGAANFGRCLDGYSRGFIRMIHHLESMVMYLQTISQQHEAAGSSPAGIQSQVPGRAGRKSLRPRSCLR